MKDVEDEEKEKDFEFREQFQQGMDVITAPDFFQVPIKSEVVEGISFICFQYQFLWQQKY